jgi:uncharacterized protein
VTASYLDSSAIVKLYADEDHHDAVRSLAGGLVTVSLARVEVTAAFYGKARAGEVPISVAQVLATIFLADWNEGRFLVIASDTQIESEAVSLVARYPFPGFDAVHLATANAARRALPECSTFACFDKKLNAAAAGELFTLL